MEELFIPTLIMTFIAIGAKNFWCYVIAAAMWWLTLK
jgi:hypothetical protein